MRIGIDAQTTLGEKTGFGFYVENLTRALQKTVRGDEFKLLYPEQIADLSTLGRWWWDQITLPALARRGRVDLLHQPAFSVPIVYSGKKIVTIHDVISLLHPNIPFFSRQFYSKWMPFSYRFADHFITISEHSKRDIHQKLGIATNRITVIYLAADDAYRNVVSRDDIRRVEKKYQINPPYVLNVGTINPRKNLEFLVTVFAEAKKTHKLPHTLVVAGKKGWHYDTLFRKVKDLGLGEQVLFTGYVDDVDKPALYHGADLFLFPSIYEGFGLPPLEAMFCGTPVISSNTSSLPEVIGAGGIGLSPHDTNGWVEAMAHVLNTPALRKKLVEQGRKQASTFSWDRCARETLAVYHMVTEVPNTGFKGA